MTTSAGARINPWSSLAGLPREVWIVCAATLVNRAGQMALPFLLLFLTREHAMTAEQAGMVVGLFGIGSIVAGPASGRLVDRVGPRPIMIGSLFISGILLFLVPYVEQLAFLVAVTFFWAVTGEAVRPASMAAITTSVAPELRKPAYSALRLAINLGMSVGPALGGFLAARSFDWVFLVDGTTSFAAAAILLFTPWRRPGVSAPQSDAPAAAKPHSRAALRDPALVFFLVAFLPLIFVIFQSMSTMAVYVVDHLHLSMTTYGLLFTLNTVMIVFMEVRLSAATAHWPHTRALVLGAVLTGLGFGALALAHDAWTAAATVVIWTFGEMILFPAANAFIAERAPEGRTGEYMGLYVMTFGVGLVLAPWLGTQVMTHVGPRALWVVTLLASLASAAAFARVYSPRPSTPGGST